MTIVRLTAAMTMALFALWLVAEMHRVAAGCAPC